MNRKKNVYCIKQKEKKIYFLTVNTKYISSRDLKTSKFSLVLRTRENFDVFNSLYEMSVFNFDVFNSLTHSIWYSPQKSKYPLFTDDVM